jgi:hypothetical protein
LLFPVLRPESGLTAGQAYVALWRVTSLEGLQVISIKMKYVFRLPLLLLRLYRIESDATVRSQVMAHPKVAVWSRMLETVQ